MSKACVHSRRSCKRHRSFVANFVAAEAGSGDGNSNQGALARKRGERSAQQRACGRVRSGEQESDDKRVVIVHAKADHRHSGFSATQIPPCIGETEVFGSAPGRSLNIHLGASNEGQVVARSGHVCTNAIKERNGVALESRSAGLRYECARAEHGT